MTQKRLFIIDGMALIYRSHFAMIKNPLTTKNGQHTSAIYGLANSIFKIVKEEKPDFLAVAMDCREPTFRHKMYDLYKANREAMPEELVSQLSHIDEMIKNMNIPIIRKPGYEADDIMGTLAKHATQQEIHTYLVSGDKDLMQVVSDSVKLYTPGSRFKPTTVYGPKEVEEKWGVTPDKMIEFLSLLGDSSDNIPGVDGVGKKTAAKLLMEYGNTENILQNIDSIKNKRVREGLSNGGDKLDLAIKLVSLDNDVELDLEIKDLVKCDMDSNNLKTFFNDMEIHSLSNQLESLGSKDSKQTIKPKKDYRTILSKTQLEDLIQKLLNSNLISIDIETSKLDPIEADIVGLSISIKPNQGYYIPIIFPTQESNDDYNLDLVTVLNLLKRVLEDDKIKKCGQNLKYDSLILKRHGIDLNGIQFDSMIAEHVLHPEKNSYKLDNLSIEYFGYEMQPIEDLIGKGKEQISMSDVPLKDISFYAIEDADIALQLTKELKPLIEKNKLKDPYYDIEIPLIPILVEMENTGAYVDREILDNLSVEVDEKIEKLKTEIFSISNTEFNINSPKQLAVVLFDELKLKQIKKRSTSIEVLEELKFHHPLPELILQYRHLSKLSSTYIKALPEHINTRTGRVHTSFNQTIAATGRLSSTKPNFQNIPIRTDIGKQIRKAIRAQNEDSVILSADYSQIELRIMAHYSKEPELIHAFKNDIDIHTRTAALVFKVDEKDVTSDQRRTAKIVNFGIMYGAGPFRMSKELGISMKDSKSLIETYFETYPGIQTYIQETIEEAHLKGYVSTLNGRKRYAQALGTSNMNIQKAEERALINMPIQGTAAELIKIAMINIHNKIQDRKLNSKMILQIHDELIFEVPKYEIESFSELVKFEMEKALKLSIPLKVDFSWGPSWFDAH